MASAPRCQTRWTNVPQLTSCFRHEHCDSCCSSSAGATATGDRIKQGETVISPSTAHFSFPAQSSFARKREHHQILPPYYAKSFVNRLLQILDFNRWTTTPCTYNTSRTMQPSGLQVLLLCRSLLPNRGDCWCHHYCGGLRYGGGQPGEKAPLDRK